MKKLIVLTIAVTLLAACQTERTAEQVNVEINKTRNQIAQLTEKLNELETELASMDLEDLSKGTRVTVFSATPGEFTDYIDLSGMVEAVNSASIMPETSGTIEKIHVREGQWVSRNDLLISLDSEIMEKSLEEMQKGYELAKTLYEKQKELFDQGVGSEVQYLQSKNQKESMEQTMKTLRAQMEMSEIRAPFAGRIEEIYLKTGENASPGRAIIDLVNTSSLYINTEVSEAFIKSIQSGDPVELTFPNLPDVTREVPISFVSQVIDPQSRTFSIRLEMRNPNGEIKPNMLVNMRLKVYDQKDVLLVPTILVRQDLEGSFLYIARPHDGEYFATKTYVKTGRSDGTHSIIEEGLEPGDLVIDNGYNQVNDGTKLQIENE